MISPRQWSITNKFLAVGILVLLLLAIYFVQSQYFQKPLQQAKIQHVTCPDLVRGCGIDGVYIKFDHQPQVMQPFHLQLQTAGAENVAARFAMVGMQMGLNRYRLLQQTPGNWSAEIILPICVQSRSDWLVDIEITKENAIKRYQLVFTSSGGQAR